MAFEESELDRSEWSLGSASFDAIRAEMARLPAAPTRILEFGSGASTRAFASLYPEASIVSVDHDGTYVPALSDLANPSRVDLRVVALRHRVICGVPTFTYDFNPEGSFDVALVDGPPRRLGNGRLGALLLAYSALKPGGIVILDDAYRPSELRALARLGDMTGGRPRFVDVGHGLAVFARGDEPHPMVRVAVGAGVETFGKALSQVLRRGQRR
jgi:predicted O-methyltransferase YrrM